MNNRSALIFKQVLYFGFACAVSTAALRANPTGGQVAAGSASVNTAPGTVTVNQQSNTAIINWQSFSIGAGELTKFVQPSATSAVLNRVLGGQTSLINGTLSANGQVYLLNGNGILVGPGGVVNAGGFTASTRDLSDADFLSGNLHFTGSSPAGVQNFGQVKALGGNVYFIGHTVDNEGAISAPKGTVGLAAADDVLITQGGGENVFVSPSATPASGAGKTGVHNSGTIAAASAELKAANGNIYALAIQNSGSIRATTVSHQGGRVFLVSDSGKVENTGTLDASATAAGGHGGSVTLKSGGTTIDSGKIFAKGGVGGAGGMAEISGAQVGFTGPVDLTAPGGTTGDLLLDPATLNVSNGGVGTISGGQNDSTSNTIDPRTVEAALGTANVTLNADNSITVSSGITWSSTNTLILSTNTSGSTISINAPIIGTRGGLTIAAATSLDPVTATASINVADFLLQSGAWQQNAVSLPSFTASSDFEISSNGSFLRVAGGDGATANTPYIITDLYGLQGAASLPMNNFYALANNVDATPTESWNSGAGFLPIGGGNAGSFTGTFYGQGHTINGLFINRPTESYISLFGETLSGALIEDLAVTNVVIDASFEVGGVVGGNNGMVYSVYTSGVVSAGNTGTFAGGLVGGSSGTISNSFTSVVVNGNSYVGGVVGANGGGTVTNSYTRGSVVASGSSPSNIGGLIGGNLGTVNNSFWDTDTSGATTGFGSDPTNTTAGITGATTAQLGSQSFILANAPTVPTWDFTNVWQILPNSTPTLRNTPVTLVPPTTPPVTPPATTPPATSSPVVSSFDSYTSNGSPTIVAVSFFPAASAIEATSVDEPDANGGAINSGPGSSKKGGNIASGSSTSSGPVPSRLIGPGGISSIFNGSVSPVQPPPIVFKKFDDVFGSENELHAAAFGR